jgi:hypothetical protein
MFFQMLIQKAEPVKGPLPRREKASRFSHTRHAKFDFGLMHKALFLLCCNMKSLPLRNSAHKS